MIARFDQVEGASHKERDEAWARIKATAADAYGVDISQGDWRDLFKGGKEKEALRFVFLC